MEDISTLNADPVISGEPRNSHVKFMEDRPWLLISSFWQHLNKALPMSHEKNLPDFIVGAHSLYSVTDLSVLHQAGHFEYNSKDPRFKRQTFALRIGYDGSQYAGYQMQRGQDLVCYFFML